MNYSYLYYFIKGLHKRKYMYFHVPEVVPNVNICLCHALFEVMSTVYMGIYPLRYNSLFPEVSYSMFGGWGIDIFLMKFVMGRKDLAQPEFFN